jgi:hypothetical protein
MYFLIAPFVLIGLAAKLMNNKIDKQKQNNDSLLFNSELSKFMQQMTKEADTSDTDRNKIRQFTKKPKRIQF